MIGYLGPRGTFTHQALLSFADDSQTVAFPSVNLVLDAVRSGEIDSGLVPIENSVEGGVSATLDSIGKVEEEAERLMIIREVLLQVEFDLMVRPGTKFEDITQIITHPHAAAQCRNWLAENMPDATVHDGGSTAGAAKEVSNPESRFDAAICATVAGDMYGLTAARKSIADNKAAVTRFIEVSRVVAPPRATGADKTTFTVYMHRDRSGALSQILEILSSRGVNLTRIESRPTKTALGSYCFSIDAEGHIRDERLGAALMDLRRICQNVVFLGSYARADGTVPDVPFGCSDGDYRSARIWLDDLLNGR